MLDQMIKQDERNMILRNQEVKQSIDFSMANNFNAQKKDFSMHQKAFID